MTHTRIGVIGAGAWGTALAHALATPDCAVTLWAHEPDLPETINATRTNPAYLPGVALSPHLHATARLNDLAGQDALLIVAPAQHVRGVLTRTPVGDAPLVLCAKGIESAADALMTDVAHAVHPLAPLAVLSGPTFAHEVARGLPAGVTLACEGRALWHRLAPLIARPAIRPYFSDDLIGAQVGGAVKNVLAIACGAVDGAGLGLNARAALIARGFAEMRRFGLALGARSETLSGLSGLGDLVLTCSSDNSRNFALGRDLGRGQPIDALLGARASVAEGAFTAPVLATLAGRHGVDMPIATAVADLVAGRTTVADAIRALLARPLTDEIAPT